MTAILGLSGYYHDSAAALIVDGTIAAAAQEERFSRKKHDSNFPTQAVQYCLQHARLSEADIDHVVFYEKPLLKFERLLETYLSFAPLGFRSFRHAIPIWLQTKLHLPREIRSGLNDAYKGRICFTEHHEAHAASAFFPSPFDEAAILTMDGVGEWATAAIGTGKGNQIKLDLQLRFPHSPGLLYSAMTYYLGFRVNSAEYKVMGLAPYGEPKYRDLILQHVIDLKDDGSFRMNMSYFDFCHRLTMTSKKFDRLFGGPPRSPDQPLTQQHKDLAASIQSVVEEIMIRMARHAKQITGMTNLVMAGGVALNCVGNGRIVKENIFDNIWIQPASGDCGGALGAAWFAWYQLLQNPRTIGPPGNHANQPFDLQQGSLLGPDFSDAAITKCLDNANAVFLTCKDDQELCQHVAKLLAQGNVVGWFQGRMEFGPRALGNRSILADPRRKDMQSVLNQKIKFRESFRPFAPIIMQERTAEYFDLPVGCTSPYMLLTANETSSTNALPAVTHVDGSARLQTVHQKNAALIRQLLEAFHAQTNCPALINTSFNIRSEPIVCCPEEALQCFHMTDMDVLVVGRHVLKKEEQTIQMTDSKRKSFRQQFPAD
ncbi:MAG: carbamoyltransferase [Fuerstiella sp.]